jgi:hypothetical protein
MFALRLNPQISPITDDMPSFFVGCVLRTTTVKIETNFVNDIVRSGALSAPYTSTANHTFNLRGHLC